MTSHDFTTCHENVVIKILCLIKISEISTNLGQNLYLHYCRDVSLKRVLSTLRRTNARRISACLDDTAHYDESPGFELDYLEYLSSTSCRQRHCVADVCSCSSTPVLLWSTSSHLCHGAIVTSCDVITLYYMPIVHVVISNCGLPYNRG